MKNLFAILLLLGSVSVSAEIVQPKDSDIDGDLGFKWEEDVQEKSDRQVASEEEKKSEDEQGERELASEQEGSGIQFWKYQEE